MLTTDRIKTAVARAAPMAELAGRAATAVPGQPVAVRGLPGSLLAFAAAKLFEERSGQLLLIASDEDRAERLRDDCALLLGEAAVKFFGARPTHRAQTLDMSSSIAQIETLKALIAGSRMLIVASPQSIAENVPPPEEFRRTVIEIRAHEACLFQKLIDRLGELGFERKNFVESYGDFAVRGGILDVFPYVGEHPVRVEFWGDTVESIREFDVLSQRSIRDLQLASVVPAIAPPPSAGDDGAPSAARPAGSLFDYLDPAALLFFDEPELIERAIGELASEGAADLFTFADLRRSSDRFARIEHTSAKSAGAIDLGAKPQPAYNGSINTLVAQLRRLAGEGYTIILASDTESESRRLRELIGEVLAAGAVSEAPAGETPPENQIPIEYVPETVHGGFLLPAERLALFTEHEIFNRLRRRGLAKRRRFKGFSQKELQQLRRGDYVVHVDHGIGTFAGLVKISVGAVEQEVMKLLFLESDVLYVNLNFINRVQKFSSQEGHVPALSKLGTGDWARMKERAKKRIKDIAREIIALYAKRRAEPGFAFSHDTHWQKELEASFMYEDTADQATATFDVKQDMERASPMDRLVCGDVGFGKTEVAVRAAFKAVMDGKQVAILVPTTILAIQHYNTFQDRLARYTTRVEQITRFKSAKEQKRIVEQLRAGGVDILIGTHRLLSKDIVFKDLGLLIVDEEHRFGVTAKEKLRHLRANVDTLALTATPIPRTLHFSLIGARDLSLIATPPRNRLPIMTELIFGDGTGRQWDVVREAILKELHRGGQIYVVHDRVQDIDAIADQVRRIVPQARVHVAHGQMSGHELEKTMIDFLEKKHDVLVCTKIIESGVDIPSVNTIVINRADRFGLAELYQLRGRVGRSNVQAYAYLLTPSLSAMPKPTLRRLQAIEEFTELGSGFNLAMRDLEIRGAGNLLGAEQSGFIMEMGFELYERIVREAVEELKQEEFRPLAPAAPQAPRPTETVIDADVDALIPDVYIESDAERLDVYRRLYRASADEELQALRLELRDRFGEYPDEVEHLFLLVGLRLAAARLGFPKISLKGSMLVLTLPHAEDQAFYGGQDETTAPFQKIVRGVGKNRMVQLKQEGASLLLVIRQEEITQARERFRAAEARLAEIGEWILG